MLEELVSSYQDTPPPARDFVFSRAHAAMLGEICFGFITD